MIALLVALCVLVAIDVVVHVRQPRRRDQRVDPLAQVARFRAHRARLASLRDQRPQRRLPATHMGSFPRKLR